MTIWLPAAAREVTRATWERHRPERGGGWFIFGGCGFWFFVFYVWVAWTAAKAVVWLAVLAVLTVAQGVSLLGELAWWLVAPLRWR